MIAIIVCVTGTCHGNLYADTQRQHLSAHMSDATAPLMKNRIEEQDVLPESEEELREIMLEVIAHFREVSGLVPDKLSDEQILKKRVRVVYNTWDFIRHYVWPELRAYLIVVSVIIGIITSLVFAFGNDRDNDNVSTSMSIGSIIMTSIPFLCIFAQIVRRWVTQYLDVIKGVTMAGARVDGSGITIFARNAQPKSIAFKISLMHELWHMFNYKRQFIRRGKKSIGYIASYFDTIYEQELKMEAHDLVTLPQGFDEIRHRLLSSQKKAMLDQCKEINEMQKNALQIVRPGRSCMREWLSTEPDYSYAYGKHLARLALTLLQPFPITPEEKFRAAYAIGVNMSKGILLGDAMVITMCEMFEHCEQQGGRMRIWKAYGVAA